MGSRGLGVQGVQRGSEGFRGVQGFRGSGVQGFRGSGVQGFRGSGVQGFRGSGVQGSMQGSGLGQGSRSGRVLFRLLGLGIRVWEVRAGADWDSRFLLDGMALRLFA